MSSRDPRFGSKLTARQTVAVLLVVVALVWVLVNGPVEGPVLVVFSPAHGLTVADLPAPAAVAVAVILVWPARHRRESAARRGQGPRHQDDRDR